MKNYKKIFEFSLLFLLMLFLGILYTWSYVATILQNVFGWGSELTSNIFTCSITFYSIGNIIGGLSSRHFSSSVRFLGSALLICIGLCFLTIRMEFYPFLFFYGVVYSFGIGLAYNTAMGLAKQYFSQKLGTGMGILLFSNGSTAFLFGSIIQYILQEKGVFSFFLPVCCILAILLCAAALLFRSPKPSAFALCRKPMPVSFQILKSRNFYILYFWGGLIASLGLFVVGQSASIAAEITSYPYLLSHISGWVALANGSGRIISGVLFDKKGIAWSTRNLSLLSFGAALLLCFSFYARIVPVCTVAILLCAYLLGAVSPSLALFARTFFAPEQYEFHFSLFASEIILSSVIGSSITGKAASVFGTYSYSILLLCIMAFIICLLELPILKLSRRSA